MPINNWTLTQVLGQMVSGRSWSDATITYAFPTLASGMYSRGEAEGFLAVPANQYSTFDLAVMTWDDLIPNNFTRVPEGATSNLTNIEYAYTTTNISFAHAYQPSNGSAWFKSGSVVSAAAVGSQAFKTLLHETGHALGLEHMGDYNGEGDFSPSSFQDSVVLSVMSYFGPEGTAPLTSNDVMGADWVSATGVTVNAQTPMVNDVMVIQSIYGVSATTRTDNTVYGFNTMLFDQEGRLYDFTINRNPVLTIFDSAGNDTIDLSEWTSTSNLTLVPGAYSSVNNMTNNLAIAYSASIENAITGSGNDSVTGNSLANTLNGGAGNDSLFGLLGDDILLGDAGNDTLDGGGGYDTAFYGGSFGSYTITYDAPTGSITLRSSSETEIARSIELFRFSDAAKTLAEMLVGDTTAPTLASSTPADNASGVALDSLITLQFSEYVVAGSGTLVLRDASGAEVDSADIGSARVSIDGSSLTFDPYASLRAGGSYSIELSAGALKDLAGNVFAGISGASTLNFTMSSAADTSAPALVGMSPADDSTKVAVDSNFTLTFDEAVRAGSGSIVITTRTGAVAATIAVGDTGQVDISGKVVTLNPAASLAAGTAYYVSFAAGVFVDASGNANAGLAGSGAYNFKTAGVAADDFAFTTATTGVLAVGTPALGSVETVGDKDLFKVTLVAGVSYVFDLTRSNVDGLADPYLFLYDSAFQEIKNDDDGGLDHQSQITFTATTSGTYYLGAMDFDDGLGDYTLSASSSSVNSAPSGALSISGSMLAGQVLTAVSTLADVDGLGALAYQWQSSSDGINWSNIAGATAATYTVAADVASSQLRVSASYTDQLGHAEQVSSIGVGGSGADSITGSAVADVISAGAGNDVIRGGAGNDSVDGGAGIDTSIYLGARSQYTLVKTSTGVTVTDNSGAEGSDTLVNVERLSFGDGAFALDTSASGLAGQSYRLYQAAFARTPDAGGVGFWMKALDSGMALSDIAAGFVDSAEYKALYPSTLTNVQLVTQYYTNILGRAPDQGGVDYWTNALNTNIATVPEVLAFISESAENINLTAAVIGNGFAYTPYG